jgi:pimeloyl-ACP methyl ester carboxylesterase
MAPVLDYVYEVTGLRAMLGEIPSEAFVDDIRARASSKTKLNEEIGYGLAMLCDALTFDSVRELQCLRRPTTIFHGTADSVVPFEVSRRVSELAPLVHLIPIVGADHGFAVAGDDDLTHLGTKANHRFVYQQVLLRLTDD